MQVYHLTEAEKGAAGDYEQVLYWKLTESTIRLLWMQGLQLALLFLMAAAFTRLVVTLGRLPLYPRLGLQELLIGLAGLGVMVVLHELVHGLAMTLFGAQPRFGVIWKMLVFYATAPGYGFRRNSYVVVALAPLVVVSLISILGIWLLQGTSWVALPAVIAVFNGAGAAGDLWMAGVVLRYPSSAYIVDERDGMRVLVAVGER